MAEMSRAERLAANEAEMRAVNEQLPGAAARRPLFLCECSESSCGGFVHLTEAAYRDIHADPMQFVVVPGHANLEIETVVEETEGYHVVRKPEAMRHVVDPAAGG